MAKLYNGVGNNSLSDLIGIKRKKSGCVMRTVDMSDFTVGDDAFDAIPETLATFGAKKIVLAGGKRALAAAAPGIKAAVAQTDIEVTDTIVYGTECTQDNIDRLVNNPAFRDADVAFAIGGGKAIDTVKTAAHELNKIVFSVPTICSNCSAATAIAVVYNNDGSMSHYAYPPCPVHIFINPQVIAEAPEEYFWAGIGDALSKQPEVEYATSKDELDVTAELGLSLAHTCSEPLFRWGEQGLDDVRANRSSEAVKRIALDIVINTGYVSNLTNQPDFYYNSTIAHAFYNGTTGIHREGSYLHGQIVSFGVLVLFAYANDQANLERYAAFNKKLGLPVTLAEIGLGEDTLPQLEQYAEHSNEWKQQKPEPIEPARFIQAIKDADAFGRELLAQ